MSPQITILLPDISTFCFGHGRTFEKIQPGWGGKRGAEFGVQKEWTAHFIPLKLGELGGSSTRAYAMRQVNILISLA